MPAILFGSISSLADTSELQRRAFNDAFLEHRLDWSWSQDDYRAMLSSNGGADRVASYAAERGVDVDAQAVHQTKSRIFQSRLAEGGAELRSGVAATLRQARENGYDVGLVTTTSLANVDALLAALADDLGDNSFDIVVSLNDAVGPKPDPAAYEFTLEHLGLQAGDAIAIEDNTGGVQAAASAGVRVIAFPNENTVGGDFSGAIDEVDTLDPEFVLGLIADSEVPGSRRA